MTRKSSFTIVGTNTQILAPIPELDFFDTQSIDLPRPATPLDAWRIVMSQPMPILSYAFKVRDAISSVFGVKKIGGFSGNVPASVEVGQMLGFFLIEYISPDILTLTERDRHLDVMTCISVSGNKLAITSSVKTHITFGRIYMIPVGPAHKMIVRNNLKQIGRALA